jgi:hypothetical protein
MMNINSKTFVEIADLLMEVDNNGECKYSVEEVADMTNVSVDTVLYVDLVANVAL